MIESYKIVLSEFDLEMLSRDKSNPPPVWMTDYRAVLDEKSCRVFRNNIGVMPTSQKIERTFTSLSEFMAECDVSFKGRCSMRNVESSISGVMAWASSTISNINHTILNANPVIPDDIAEYVDDMSADNMRDKRAYVLDLANYAEDTNMGDDIIGQYLDRWENPIPEDVETSDKFISTFGTLIDMYGKIVRSVAEHSEKLRIGGMAYNTQLYASMATVMLEKKSRAK